MNFYNTPGGFFNITVARQKEILDDLNAKSEIITKTIELFEHAQKKYKDNELLWALYTIGYLKGMLVLKSLLQSGGQA